MREINDNTSIVMLVDITVEDTEVPGAVNNSTESTSAERSDLHDNHLQVPNDSTLLNDKMDVHMNNETLHNSLRSSARNIEAEVFIITAVKCRLMATLIVVICVMILLFLAPIVWYNTDPPGAETYVTESAVFHNLEIASCMVSTLPMCIYYLHDYVSLVLL